MTAHNISKVLVYVNSYHSWGGSDCGDTKEVQKAIKYSEKMCLKLTGFTPSQLPANTDKLISFLREL